jgi:outer membrane protein assembly factor BamB
MEGPGSLYAPLLRRRALPRTTLTVTALVSVILTTTTGHGPRQATPYDWLQFGGNAQHNGFNTLETTITVNNVATLHRLFSVALPDIADGAPAYLSGAATPSGSKDLLFATTKDGHIVALDAHTGSQVWSRQYPPGLCFINKGSQPCYTTSSPAVDPNRQYVYTYGLDGYVHKLRVGDGTEVTGSGWPELATRKGFDEKGSSDLSIATARNGTSYLYVANSGYPGDRGDYQGHVTAINLASGSQHVFNALCSGQADVHFFPSPQMPDCPRVQSAIWARPGVIYSAATDRIYMSTGNGDFVPSAHAWGDSVFELNPDGTGANGGPLDSYTPVNYQSLQNLDLDLGSTAPLIMPVPITSTVRHLALQSGKDGKLRLLNLDNLSGQGGPGHIGGEVVPPANLPQGGAVLTMPALLYLPRLQITLAYVANGNGISCLRLTVNGSGTPNLTKLWQTNAGATSPLVAGGLLYYAGSGGIRAVNAFSGRVLWQDTGIGGIHWESPIVVNGVLYITDENGSLTAYAPQGTPAVGSS